MSDKNYIGNFVTMKIPLEYVKVYVRMLAALSDYGEEMLRDCKAACTDRNYSIIECFNVFQAACAAYELGDTKKGDLLFNYVDSTLNLKYKDVTMPDSISFPVEEENVIVYFNFDTPPYFNLIEGVPVLLESLEIEGDTSVVGISSQYTCRYIPEDTTQRNVRWDITNGREYAYIDTNSGNLLVLSNANNSQVIIKATSIDNPDVLPAFKALRCTYNNEVEGAITLAYDSSLSERDTEKQVTVNVVGTSETPVKLELYKFDASHNINLLNSIDYEPNAVFNITVVGEITYFVKAKFESGQELLSEEFTLAAVPCCYIGEGKVWGDVLVDDSNKLEPMLDIGSALGKEYPVTVTQDGNFIFIIVPVIEGHMNVNEVRLDETNLSSEFQFDVDTTEENQMLAGLPYKVYGLKLRNHGFVHGNYRLLITS